MAELKALTALIVSPASLPSVTRTNYGLALDYEFERYVCVSMHDTVEEKKVCGCRSWVRLLRAFPDLPVRPFILSQPTKLHFITQQHTSIAKLGAPAAFQQSRPTSPIGSHTHHWPLTCIRVRRPLPPKRIPQHWIRLGIYGIQGLRARRTAKWDRDGRR